jgi:predicted exporter
MDLVNAIIKSLFVIGGICFVVSVFNVLGSFGTIFFVIILTAMVLASLDGKQKGNKKK